MNKKSLYARKRRQFKSLCKQLNRLIRVEQTKKIKKQINTILLKVKRLLQELSNVLAQWEVKKMLGAATLILSISGNVQGQQFAEPIMNPFGLSAELIYGLPVSTDLDGDGDYDILLATYNISSNTLQLSYFENIGGANSPLFSEAVEDPFGIEFSENTTLLSVVDLDDDGDLDVVSQGTFSYVYQENTGLATNPQLSEPVEFPFATDNFIIDYAAYPAFADFDNDGNCDLLIGRVSPGEAGQEDYAYLFNNFLYYENVETSPNEPVFDTPLSSPFNLKFEADSTFYIAVPVICDLDRDGDIDILCSVQETFDYYNNRSNGEGLYYFENIGSHESPDFTVIGPNPFNINLPIGFISPDLSLYVGGYGHTLADFDNDGDKDLLVAGSYYSSIDNSITTGFYYYENLDITTSVYGVTPDFFTISPNPSNSELYLEFDELHSRIEINITSSTGQIIHRTIKDDGISFVTLDIADYPVGVYFLSVNDGKEIQVQRFIKS